MPGNDDVIKKAFEQGVGAGFYAALMMFAMSGGWFYEFAPWVHIYVSIGPVNSEGY